MNAVDSEVTINLNVVFVQENYQEEAVQRMLNDGTAKEGAMLELC